MKYSIYINQLILSCTKLDLKDAAILEYLRAFCSVDDKAIKQLTISEKGVDFRYTWINFNHLIKEMPLLGIKQKASISERVQKIRKAGYIKTFRAPDRSLYVRLTAKIKELDFTKGKERGVSRNLKGVSVDEQKVLVKTNSTNNTSINNNINNKSIGDTSNNKKLNNQEKIREVINHFFQLKEWIGDKEYYRKHEIVFSRFTRPAKDLIKLSEVDGEGIERAKVALDMTQEWAKENKMEWSMETAIKKWFEFFPPEEDVQTPDYLKRGIEKYEKSKIKNQICLKE